MLVPNRAGRFLRPLVLEDLAEIDHQMERRQTVTQATLHTTRGDIVIDLFDNHAPKTVANFVGLAGGTKEYRDPRTGQATTGNLEKNRQHTSPAPLASAP